MTGGPHAIGGVKSALVPSSMMAGYLPLESNKKDLDYLPFVLGFFDVSGHNFFLCVSLCWI